MKAAELQQSARKEANSPGLLFAPLFWPRSRAFERDYGGIVAISSTSSATQSAELVAQIKRLLSPYAEKKDDFTAILNLVQKIANGAITPQSNGATSSAPPLLPTSPSKSDTSASSGTTGSSKLPDDLAYGYARGQFAPGTNLPVRIKWEDPTYFVQPSDMPEWDGRTPPSVPSGSVPFYSDNGRLLWLGLNGKIYKSSGLINDNSLTSYLAYRNEVSVETYISTMQNAIRSAKRPATKSELYDMSLGSTGGQYATYEPVATPEAQRAYEALLSRTSPVGYGVGQTVPGTSLPARLIPGGDPKRLITPEDMVAWDGRIPEGVPNGSIPFYSTNGSLVWLGLSGKIYNSTGMISDNTTTTLWAKQKDMSLEAFVSAVRAASAAAGRTLTLGEASTAEVSAS